MKRTWIVAAAAIGVIVAMVAGLNQLGPDDGGTPAASFLAAASSRKPTPVPTAPQPTAAVGPEIDPTTLEQCTAQQLKVLAGGWGGATGSMAGGTSLINVSPDPCRVDGKPALELRDKSGKVIATGPGASPGAPVALAPGGVAGAIVVWSNWCGDAPPRPLSLRVSLRDVKGTFTAEVIDRNQSSGVGGSEFSSLPRCDVEGAGSSIGAPEPFSTAEPPDPGEAADPCPPDVLLGFLGTWGAAAGSMHATAVLYNQGDIACLLGGSPVLQLRDADNSVVAIGEPWPNAQDALLGAGTAAVTWIDLANWCLPPPKLPLRLNVVAGGEVVRLMPVFDGSEIGTPACGSSPPAAAPTLGYDGPFAPPS
ncbi:MAG TPA: DUF4232 domain-containing protein [Candidatus Limnocylindrales bacterium]|nr:DUF4232 domain-containing protein [Candidatus Limnocylindrales bacterium]